MYQRYLLPFPNVSKTEGKKIHFDSYEKELKVLNQAYLVLGYSWTSHNSHQRMDYQKSDWEGRGGRREVWKGGGEGWGNEGSKRFMDVFGFFCLFGWFFSLCNLIEIFSCVWFLLFFLIHILTCFL